MERNVKYIVKPENKLVVCVIKEDWNNVFRGVAKCSPEDTFDEETGKRIAYLRACQKRKRFFIKSCKEDIKRFENEVSYWEIYIAKFRRKIDSMRKSIAVYQEEIEKLA